MVEFTLRNVTMILVVALVAGIALGCLGAFLHFRPEPPNPVPERKPWAREFFSGVTCDVLETRTCPGQWPRGCRAEQREGACARFESVDDSPFLPTAPVPYPPGWPEAAPCGHRMPCGLVPDSPCVFAEMSASMVLDPATIDPRYRAVREGDDLDH